MQNISKQNGVSRYYIGKVGISIVTMEQTLRLIKDQTRKMSPAYICVANVDTTILSQRDADLCKIQNESLLTIPDGMPLVWYARMIGEQNVERITGPDLMMKIFEVSSQYGYSHYFYGDTKQTLLRMDKVLQKRYPGLVIKAMRSPPFRPLSDEENNNTVAEINQLRPTFVWIALGNPKQEKWMAKIFPHIESAILIGVGAAFRFVIGEYRHPPKFVQRCGLEGLFWRGLKDPIRVTKFYCLRAPAFGALMLNEYARRILGSQR